MFSPGQEIVCINDNWITGREPQWLLEIFNRIYDLPKKGQTYHFDGVGCTRGCHINLTEYPTMADGHAPCFLGIHFAPVQRNTKTIEELRKLQNPANHKAPAPTPGDLLPAKPRELEPISQRDVWGRPIPISYGASGNARLHPNWLQIEMDDVDRSIEDEVMRAMKWLR